MTAPPRHPWQQPLPLGSGTLPNRLLPAPMEGITSPFLCAAMTARGWVDCWITPFLRVTTGVPRAATLRRKLAPYLDLGLPVVAQVMGTDISLLTATAVRLAETGVMGVDLNCGCPSGVVLRNGAGGACLRDPNWLARALCGLRNALPDCGVSVKLRTGFDTPAEMSRILPAVATGRPDFVVLHHRTVSENYAVVAGRSERFAAARELLPDVPLLASGDIRSPRDARILADLGLDGVLAARGLIADPSLLKRIGAELAEEPTAPLTEHEREQFLLDVADRARLHGIGPPGFLLNLATYLFDKKHPVWQVLRTSRDVGQAVERLQERSRDTPRE